jgi:oxygen-independent coproporphyrinogen-3 oxidase
MPKNLGIYIHVPFCAQGKCPYCDFYSLRMTDEIKEKYITAVQKEISDRALQVTDRVVDTIYFGGGTPALLGEGLARLLFCIKENFNVAFDAEITFEANPAGIGYDTLKVLYKAGFNRLSLGMQSAVPDELAALGRRHTPKDVVRAVDDARRAGFGNISLDLMLCVPGQTRQSISESVDFAAKLSPQHISAYLLKIEKGTQYYDIKETLNLPDDDEQADMYIAACEYLEAHGYRQYEISNFAHSGFESRHNLKYWDCGEYLGFGPAAHSFFDGRRFYYSRSLDGYIKGEPPVPDGDGGKLEEYVMLRLRLNEGISELQFSQRYGVNFSFFDKTKVAALERAGLLENKSGRLDLTRKGFLVSNSVITELLFSQKY